MSEPMLRVFLLALVFSSALGRLGVDLSIPLTEAQWLATFPSTDRSDSFAVLHAAFFNATLNDAALDNIAVLWRTGVSDISLYMHPCVPSSQYARANLRSCPSAQTQADALLAALQRRGISFRKHNYTAPLSLRNDSVMHRVHSTAAPQYDTSASAPVLRTLFVDVEDRVPNFFSSLLHRENVLFLAELVTHLESRGVEVGVYTTARNWQTIMTDRRGDALVYFTSDTQFLPRNPFAHLKLWTPRYDGEQSMKGVAPFFDWPAVFIKQMSGGTSDLRRVGQSRICLNFIQYNSSFVAVGARM